MRRQYRIGLCVGAMLLALLVGAPAARAQSMGTDTTDRGAVALSFDFLGSTARRPAGGFEWYLPDVAIGLPGRSEVGVSWSSVVPASWSAPHEYVPHARWRFLGDGSGFSSAIGGEWHVPVSRPDDGRAYGFLYVAASHPFGRDAAKTLSGGVYALARRSSSGETTRGLSVNWDHALSPRWSYSLEWISGTNYYGYFSPQVTMTIGDQSISAGYCVGNVVRANHGPCVSFGRTF